MADIEGKKLAELRVIDLKTELERRGLDKTGNKAALLERLSKAIAEDGEDPEEYLIIPCGGSNKINPRKNSVTGSVTHDESHDSQESNNHNKDKDDVKDNQQNSNVVKLKKETLTSSKNTTQEDVKETKKDVDEEAVTKKEEKKIETTDEPMETNKNDDKIDDKTNEPEESDKVEKIDAKNKNGIDDLIVPPPAPAPVIAPPAPIVAPSVPKPIPTSSLIAEANGIDNEDSINLTIGEDEENLLAEETETHFKQRDGGVRKRIEDNNNKKGEPIKGNCRSEATSSSSSSSSIIKDGTSSSLNSGNKIKLDTSDGGKSSDSTGIKGQKRDEKDKKTLPVNASSRNLWVSGLSSTTRATDLKQIFSRYGKVIGAKVVTNAKTPGARCYGYVTMSTNDDAAKCIQHLHKTELHGRVISVEKAKGDNQQSHTKKRDAANGKQDKKDEKEKAKDINLSSLEKKEPDQKENEEKSIDSIKKLDDKGFIDDKKIDDKDADARSTKSTSKKPDSERGRRGGMRQENHRSGSRSRSRERRRRDDVLTFAKIREERERQRLRDRERMLREEERRRREDMERQREIERRQREEAARLEREREKLRRERERIEQEKAELLRLERERQKLEREKLERERIELKRQQMRLEESRRVPPPPTMKRTSSDRRDLRELYVEPDRKRMTTEHRRGHSPSDRVTDRRTDILNRVSERRIDTPPSSGRYDSTRSSQEIGLKKDAFKRSSEFSSRSSRPDTFTDVSRGREVIVRRDTLPITSSASDPRQVKESRYERPSTTSYGRSDREVRRTDTDNHRSSRDSHTGRYSDSTKPPGSSAPGRDSRYGDSSRNTSNWHSVQPSKSSFNSVTTSGSGGGSGSVAGGGSGSGGGGNSSVSGQRSSGGGDLRNEATSWSSRSSDNPNRWNSSSSIGNTLRHPGPPMGYQGSSGSAGGGGGGGAGGGPMQSIGLTAPGTTPSYERFDPYKSSMPNMRKY